MLIPQLSHPKGVHRMLQQGREMQLQFLDQLKQRTVGTIVLPSLSETADAFQWLASMAKPIIQQTSRLSLLKQLHCTNQVSIPNRDKDNSSCQDNKRSGIRKPQANHTTTV